MSGMPSYASLGLLSGVAAQMNAVGAQSRAYGLAFNEQLLQYRNAYNALDAVGCINRLPDPPPPNESAIDRRIREANERCDKLEAYFTPRPTPLHTPSL